jgi:hypothetical protein
MTIEKTFTNQERLRQIADELSAFAKQRINFQKVLPELSISEFEFQKLKQVLRELPVQTQEALLLLGQHGWFIDPEMLPSEVWELKNALSNGNLSEVESILISYFESRLTEIEESIAIKFPHRAHLIRL